MLNYRADFGTAAGVDEAVFFRSNGAEMRQMTQGYLFGVPRDQWDEIADWLEADNIRFNAYFDGNMLVGSKAVGEDDLNVCLLIPDERRAPQRFKLGWC
jgi:hypothetical protein